MTSKKSRNRTVFITVDTAVLLDFEINKVIVQQMCHTRQMQKRSKRCSFSADHCVQARLIAKFDFALRYQMTFPQVGAFHNIVHDP